MNSCSSQSQIHFQLRQDGCEELTFREGTKTASGPRKPLLHRLSVKSGCANRGGPSHRRYEDRPGVSYRLAVCVFHVSQGAPTLHIPTSPPSPVTRRRQRLIDAREDYAFVFREPTKCAQTRNESTRPASTRSRVRFDGAVESDENGHGWLHASSGG